MRRNLIVTLSAVLVLALAVAALPAMGLVGSAQYAQLRPAGQETPQTSPEELIARAAQFWAETHSFDATADIVTRTDDGTTATTARIWFERPDNVRLQVIEGSDGLAEGSTAVFDGNTLWIYRPDENKAMVIEGTPNVLFAGRTPTPLLVETLQITQLPDLMLNLAQNSTVRVAGEDTVGDKPVQVVEAIPATEDYQFGVQRFWIEEATGLPLRIELTRPDGTTFFFLEIQEFNRNVELPDAFFRFVPPEGAEVTRVQPTETTVEMQWRDVSLDEARAQTDFVILTWAQLPPGLQQRAVRLGTADGMTAVALTYDRDGTDLTILIQHGARFETPDLPGAETVRLDDARTAQVLTIDKATQITWTQAGTRVKMITELPRDQAIALARDLGGPVPGAMP